MNKNNGILFLALAALAYGAWRLFGSSSGSFRRAQTGTTGTASFAPNESFARGVYVKGNPLPGAPGGVSSGAGIDLNPILRSGIGLLTDLAKKAFEAITGGSKQAPGTPGQYGTVEQAVENLRSVYGPRADDQYGSVDEWYNGGTATSVDDLTGSYEPHAPVSDHFDSESGYETAAQDTYDGGIDYDDYVYGEDY